MAEENQKVEGEQKEVTEKAPQKKEQEKKEKKTEPSKSKSGNIKMAVLLVRSLTSLNPDIKNTLKLLKLDSKFALTVWDKTPALMGMLTKVKDYTTYGVISGDTFKKVVASRGKEFVGRTTDSKGKIEYKGKFFTFEGKNYKKTIKLMPPRGGFERKGIKKPFTVGGVLGNRKDKINDLLLRMI